jgi:hypothetical protein
MQRSSATIGTIAAALAKAQAQLVNPEKSLTGRIGSDVTGAAGRSFRYAPLSTGLDIVRKTLSQTEAKTFALRDVKSLPRRPSRGNKRVGASVIDKNVLALAAPRRIRDREHVKAVAKHPCLVCGRRPADAHHLRFAQSTTLSRKVSDEFTVPLCRGHHREIHRCGDEEAWWRKTGIDAGAAARILWLKSHPVPSITAQATK